MHKEIEKVDYDLSKLSLEELIETNSEIVSFLEYLEEKKIDTDKEEVE